MDLSAYGPELIQIGEAWWKAFRSTKSYSAALLATALPATVAAAYLGGPLLTPAAGLVAFAANRLVDYITTCRVVEEMDNEFFRYGLDKECKETGLPECILPRHPKPAQLYSPKLAALETMAGTACAVAPAAGLGILATTPLIYFQHSRALKIVRHAKALGRKAESIAMESSEMEKLEKFLEDAWTEARGQKIKN